MARGGRDGQDGSSVPESVGERPWWEVWLRHRLVAGLVFGALFGPTFVSDLEWSRRVPMLGILVVVFLLASLGARRSPADELNARDAARVRAAVRRGLDVGTDRLAAATRGEADLAVHTADRRHRWRWPAAATLVLVGAMVALADDWSTWARLVVPVAAVIGVVDVFTARRRRDRAERAADAARLRLPEPVAR